MSQTGTQPGRWLAGPDPLLHAQRRAWIQQRNQAQWRGEQWLLTLAEWTAIWGADWPRRGRDREGLCMTRRDQTQAWCPANTHLVTRLQHAANQAGWREDGTVSAARKRLKAKKMHPEQGAEVK